MPLSLDSAPPQSRVPGTSLLGARVAVRLVLLLVVTVLLVAVGSPAASHQTRGSSPGSSIGGASTGRGSLVGRWSWPVSEPHPILTAYEHPAEVWSPGHRGIDIGVAETPDVANVFAPETGVVHFAGVVVDRPVLSLEHAGGRLSSFEPVVAIVQLGETVEAGQPIGVVQPGHCGAVDCVHLGARIDGEYVNPLVLLGEIRPAVLLPTRR